MKRFVILALLSVRASDTIYDESFEWPTEPILLAETNQTSLNTTASQVLQTPVKNETALKPTGKSYNILSMDGAGLNGLIQA